MKLYVSIEDILDHMVSATREMFRNTTNADNFVFHHKALSLMTTKSTKQYMIEKDYLKYRFLPEMDLYRNHPYLKVYYNYNRPPENFPKLCSLDSNLNQNFHLCVDGHVGVTKDYSIKDLGKLYLGTLERGSDAYLKIFHPTTGLYPSSSHIIQDTLNVK